MEFDLQLFGPAAGWAVPAGIGLIGSIMGNNQKSHAAQQAADGQNQVNDQMMQIYAGMSDEYKKMYAPLLGPLSQAISGMQKTGAVNQSQDYGALQSLLIDPSKMLSGQSQYGGMNLARLQNEMLHGMDPATKQYALGQVQKQGLQSTNQLENSLGSAIPNASGFAGDIAMKTLDASAQENASLASQDQSIKDNAGSQLQALAGGIDQSGIQNLLQALGLAQGTQDNAATFIGQGKSFLPGAASGMSGISNQYAQAGQNAAAGMTNPFSGFANSLAGSSAFQKMYGGGK